MDEKTIRLRAMLDKHGVKYTIDDGYGVKVTTWAYIGDLKASFIEYDNGNTDLRFDNWGIPPEHAIAATIGVGKLIADKLDNVLGRVMH